MKLTVLSAELAASKQNLSIQGCYFFICVIFNTSVLKVLFFFLQDLLVLEEQEVNVNLPLVAHDLFNEYSFLYELFALTCL